MAVSGSQMSVDVMKLSEHLINKNTDEIRKTIEQNLVNRFSKIEMRFYDGYPALLVKTKEDLTYLNPETGVTAILPAESQLGWMLSRDTYNGTFIGNNGIYTIDEWEDDIFTFGAWDCTDFYGEEDTTHPYFPSLLMMLGMVDLLLMHATNLDGYDGSRDSGGARSKYCGDFKMILKDVPEVHEHGGRDESDDEDTFWCVSCEEYWDYNQEHVLYNGNQVCDDCYSDYYAQCESCGRIFNREDMHFSEVDDVYYCNDHANSCEWCDDYAGSLEAVGSLMVCSCCKSELKVCEGCCTVFKSDNESDTFCGVCLEKLAEKEEAETQEVSA